MRTLRQLNYLLDKNAKIKTLQILGMIFLGSVAELIGVSILFPIVSLAIDDSAFQNNWIQFFSQEFNLQTKRELLLALITITVIIYIMKSIYLCFMNSRLYYFAAEIKRRLATELMESYLAQPYEFFLQQNSSDIIRSVNSDTAQLYEVLTNVLTIATNGITVICLIIYLSITNIVMTGIVAGLLGACGLTILFVVQKNTRYYGKVNQEMSSYLIRCLQQTIDGIKEIKIIGNEKYFTNDYNRAYKQQTEVVRLSKLVNLLPKYLIEGVCVSGILVFLGTQVLWNEDYLEMIPQLSVFALAAYKLLPSVNAIYAYTNTIIYNRASIELVYNDIQKARELRRKMRDGEVNTAEEIELRSQIELRNVKFTYQSGNRKILDNTSMVIKKGESIGFIGPSGGGKTTTVDVLIGLLQPQSGMVLVDGVDISNNLNGWHQCIGYIPQSIYLTDDTIRNNIAFGVNQVDDARLWQAIKDAQLEEFVQGLELGIDTIVGENGSRISGGQRQRIGIARALYRNPQVLILDEATSALDNQTEEQIMDAVEGLHGKMTIMMIAHRLSTIQNCDRVFRVEDGQIFETREIGQK